MHSRTWTSLMAKKMETSLKKSFVRLVPMWNTPILMFVTTIEFQIAEKRRANKEALEEDEEEDGVADAAGSNPHGAKNTVRQRRQ